MIMSNEIKTHFRFFLPQCRVLSEKEKQELPEEKKKAAEAAGPAGVWLEIPCPGGSCVEREGKITIEAVGAEPPKDRGVWLNIFCPEDRCLYKSGVELP
jgi:hypothetical protein